MEKIEHVYETYIRTTPEKLWAAITQPEFTRQYWGGGENVSTWKQGAKWQHHSNDAQHTVRMTGQVVESVPPKLLVLTWADPADLADESRVSFELEPMEDLVRLKVVHGQFKPGSTMAGKVMGGWPRVLASLKSLLETGEALNVWAGRSCGK